MILFYIDESGTGLDDKQTPFFVLSAVAIDAKDWITIDSRVTALKRRLVSWAKPEDFEIKGRDLRRGEKLFKSMAWPARARAINEVAQLMADAPCQIYAVQVDKRDLPESIGSAVDLYRMTFWRLLDELETELGHQSQPGMLMIDARSDLHSSVQDRRLIDAYREWLGSRRERSHFVDVPWFGFSAFYAGLQLADFAAYLMDIEANERVRAKPAEEARPGTRAQRDNEMRAAINLLRAKTKRIRLP
jgi:hypothetical protein